MGYSLPGCKLSLATIFSRMADLPSGKSTSSLNRPPSQSVLSFPGTPHSHFFRSKTPCVVRTGFAKKPKGWSRRHCLLSYDELISDCQGHCCQSTHTAPLAVCSGTETCSLLSLLPVWLSKQAAAVSVEDVTVREAANDGGGWRCRGKEKIKDERAGLKVELPTLKRKVEAKVKVKS